MILINAQPVDLTSIDEVHIGSGSQETPHRLREERATSTIGFDRVWGGSAPRAKVLPLHVDGSQWDGSVPGARLIECREELPGDSFAYHAGNVEMLAEE